MTKLPVERPVENTANTKINFGSITEILEMVSMVLPVQANKCHWFDPGAGGKIRLSSSKYFRGF